MLGQGDLQNLILNCTCLVAEHLCGGLAVGQSCTVSFHGLFARYEDTG